MSNNNLDMRIGLFQQPKYSYMIVVEANLDILECKTATTAERSKGRASETPDLPQVLLLGDKGACPCDREGIDDVVGASGEKRGHMNLVIRERNTPDTVAHVTIELHH